MRLFIVCLAVLALLFASSATACPPVDPDGGGSFSYGGYGAEACAAPMIAGNFGGYGGTQFAAPSYGVQSFVAPSYGASFAAPSYSYGGSVGFAAPAPIFTMRQFRAQSVMPVYGGGFGGRRFRGGYGSAVVAAPVVRQRIVAAPVYGYGTVVTAPVVAVPVRAPGPIRGAVQGFFGGVRNRLNGF
jgi:hypothetical protein